MKLVFRGLNKPYTHSYLLESSEEKQCTRLTFRFELIEIEVFMLPFQKLIRTAIEEGAEKTLENIKNLIIADSNQAILSSS